MEMSFKGKGRTVILAKTQWSETIISMNQCLRNSSCILAYFILKLSFTCIYSVLFTLNSHYLTSTHLTWFFISLINFNLKTDSPQITSKALTTPCSVAGVDSDCSDEESSWVKHRICWLKYTVSEGSLFCFDYLVHLVDTPGKVSKTSLQMLAGVCQGTCSVSYFSRRITV